MGLTRLITILLVLWLGWLLFRYFRTHLPQRRRRRPRQNAKGGVVTMCRCDYCGLHVPKQEAIYDGNATYCCLAHQQAAKQVTKDE
ncbi:MAG: hypothetical protein GY862_39625 [Gammaproteobacteria bacterium]|nr:hypothetical protein [Gammaproteobacteria bacterium]